MRRALYGSVKGRRMLRATLLGSHKIAVCSMTGFTLNTGGDLLQKAHESAAPEHTSLAAVACDSTARYVGARLRQVEALDALDALAERNHSRGDSNWTRPLLHERPC